VSAYQDYRAGERDVNGSAVAKTGDFWSDLTAGGVLGFVDDIWVSDEERMNAAIRKTQADAQLATVQGQNQVAQAETARKQAVQMALIGLGALVVVAGGFMAYRSMGR
jgi:hypothetical protein